MYDWLWLIDTSRRCSSHSLHLEFTQSIYNFPVLMLQSMILSSTTSSFTYSLKTWLVQLMCPICRGKRYIMKSQRIHVTKLFHMLWLWHATHICTQWLERLNGRCINLSWCMVEQPSYSWWQVFPYWCRVFKLPPAIDSLLSWAIVSFSRVGPCTDLVSSF